MSPFSPLPTVPAVDFSGTVLARSLARSHRSDQGIRWQACYQGLCLGKCSDQEMCHSYLYKRATRGNVERKPVTRDFAASFRSLPSPPLPLPRGEGAGLASGEAALYREIKNNQQPPFSMASAARSEIWAKRAGGIGRVVIHSQPDVRSMYVFISDLLDSWGVTGWLLGIVSVSNYTRGEAVLGLSHDREGQQ
jgi:hypothetical protein